MPHDVVADSSTLSNFARSSHFDLLLQLFPAGLWATLPVIAEIQQGVDRGYTDLAVVLAAQGD